MSECTEKVLPSGERVACHAPCERFPEGRQVLIPANSMRATMEAVGQGCCSGYADLKAAQAEALAKAKAALADVPPEKRCI